MKLWIDEQPYSPTDFDSIRRLSLEKSWLVPVADFLEFWFSDQAEFKTQTSGSTSSPKSIHISRARIVASAKATLDYFQFSSESDGMILCLSARHVGGFMVLARGLLADIDVWILEPSSKPIPEDSPMLSYKKWFISLVPMQLEVFQDSERLQKASELWKGILLGGSSLSSLNISQTRFLRCPVYQSYGMTETVSHVAIRQILSDLEQENPYTLLPGVDIDTDENERLMIKGAVTDFEWLQTNDRVKIVSPNAFFYLGRADDMINSGAIKMDPILLKKMYLRVFDWPDESVQVLGIPDETLGQKVVLILGTQFGSQLPDLKYLEAKVLELSSAIDSIFLPKAIYSVPDFPLTATFKIDKPALAQQVALLQPIWQKHPSVAQKR